MRRLQPRRSENLFYLRRASAIQNLEAIQREVAGFDRHADPMLGLFAIMRSVRASAGRPPTEDAVSWRPAGLEGVEALAARYSRQFFEPHRHDGFLVGVIESGAHAVWCRGDRHLAGPGTLATFDPCEAHHGGAGHPGGWRQRILYVSSATVAEVLEDAADASADRAPHFRQCFSRDEALAARFLEVHRMLDDTASIALERQSRFEALLAEVFLRHGGARDRPEPRGRDDVSVERARDYLHAHIAEPCPLPDLARVAGLRRRRFVDAFTRRFALPPHRYLIQLRVDAARPLLASGLSPAEVAAALGFSDQSHFIRRFKAVVGVTPGRWQMLHVRRRT